MSRLSVQEQAAISEAQARYLANGGEIHRMPTHAAATGKIRFNFATKAARAREAQQAADGLEEVCRGQ
jgi:uncharacterized protein (DUF1330 family)